LEPGSVVYDGAEKSLAIVKYREKAWSTLTPTEKTLVKEGFPVLYGIRPSTPDTTHVVSSHIPGEVALIGGAPTKDIQVIFVPKAKIPQVQTLLKQNGNTHTKVEAIEPLVNYKSPSSKDTHYFMDHPFAYAE